MKYSIEVFDPTMPSELVHQECEDETIEDIGERIKRFHKSGWIVKEIKFIKEDDGEETEETNS